MGFSSQPGQVGFGVQGSRGTAVAATRFAKLRSGSLGADRSLLIPEAEIGGHRDIPRAYLGPVAFSGDFEFYPRMQMLALLMRAVLGSAASTNVAGTNEVQTVTVTGTPTGGTFKLRFRGENTAALNWNSTSAEIVTALNALATIAPGDVVGTGGPLPGSAVTLTFGAAYLAKNVPLLVVVDKALTGGTAPNVTIATPTPGVQPVGTHIITPADVLPWLTVEERVSTGFESFQYVDAKVNTLRLEAEATDFLMGSANIAALTQSSGFSAQASPAWDESPMMVGTSINVRFNGAVLPGAKSFNLEINNNIETDDFNLGSISPADMTEKRREVRGGFTYRPQNSTLWKAAMYGGTAYTTPQSGPGYEGALQFDIQSIETIGDVSGGTPFRALVDIPHAVLSPFKVTPSGDDVIQNDIEWTAIRPDSAEPIMTVTITNDLATVT